MNSDLLAAISRLMTETGTRRVTGKIDPVSGEFEVTAEDTGLPRLGVSIKEISEALGGAKTGYSERAVSAMLKDFSHLKAGGQSRPRLYLIPILAGEIAERITPGHFSGSVDDHARLIIKHLQSEAA